MTIAACYVTNEGVVLGADSTSTMRVLPAFAPGPDIDHHFNYAQKLFEVGQGSSFGVVMWGMGAVGDLSHRTLIAMLADLFSTAPPKSVEDASNAFASLFWTEYVTRYASARAEMAKIRAIDPAVRTADEHSALESYEYGFAGGYCLAGRVGTRTPEAFEIVYRLGLDTPPVPNRIDVGSVKFWGVPILLERMLYGIDFGLSGEIIKSGKWSGTPDELYDLVRPFVLGQPYNLPLREAVDWVYSAIFTTIKAMKFSHLAPTCGGPIEIATITSDRNFRWVKHKRLDHAVE